MKTPNFLKSLALFRLFVYTKVKLVSILILMTILVLALVLFNSFKYKEKKVELNIEQKSTVVMRIVPATQSPLPIINDSVKNKELEPKQEVRPKTIEKIDAPKEKPLKKDRVIASMCFVPNAAGMLIANYIIKDIIKI